MVRIAKMRINKKLFHLLLPYMNAKFYAGHIRWLLMRRVPLPRKCVEIVQGGYGYVNVGCAFCGNIANGQVTIKIGHHDFILPVCKGHIAILNPKVEVAPFHVRISQKQLLEADYSKHY